MKIQFKKELRAGWIHRMVATFQFRMVCLLVSYIKMQKLKYTGIILPVVLYGCEEVDWIHLA
jgi:hypothetical protein